MTYQPPPPAYQPPPRPPKNAWYHSAWVPAVAIGIVAFGVGIAAGQGGTKTETKTVTVAGPTVTASATVTSTPVIQKVIATKTQTVRVTFTPPPPTAFGNGTYVVGRDIKAGEYHADAGSTYCAWIRASDHSGSAIIDLGNTSGGPLNVVIQPSDGSFVVQGDCSFHRVA